MCQQLDCTNENPELRRYSWKFQKIEEKCRFDYADIFLMDNTSISQTRFIFFKLKFVYNNGYVFVGDGLNQKSSGGFVLIRVYGVLFLYL